MLGGNQSVSLQAATVYTRSVVSGTDSVQVSGYQTLESVDQLPETQTSLGYMIDGDVYVWVGEGGDTPDGRYKIAGNTTLR